MKTYAQLLIEMCPMHSRPRRQRKGFACRCKDLNDAFHMGARAVKREKCRTCGGPK